ncbi:hypothetical protein L210DRAFT_3525234 [Boletus edulis BED1]|uniref:Wax synthase domain-containing protein n=1 Tax=Boletus edulis BED1 TaxID=1328754 RepID=A0AAD4C2H8_BOLED|nr:hypothetical protein L210DRAFT_3525234 [Boletus edulis BED1]
MTLFSFAIPPVLGYFLVALLAVSRQTHTIRVALWPAVTFFAYRAAVSVDMSSQYPDTRYYNSHFVGFMVFIIIRTFDWSLEKEPLSRALHPAKGSRPVIIDALDLATTMRGQGWDWSHGVHIPRETRPTDRTGFTYHVISSAVLHSIICGVFSSAIRSFSPRGLGAPSGGSIFDETLPFYVWYPRACVISLFAAFTVYSAIQSLYDICTIIGVLIFQQDPARWPPAFDAPWRATSLRDLWGRRWHQFFRRTFLIQGGYPLSFILGKAGIAIGSFISSAVFHHVAVLSLNDRAEAWRMVVGFGMMAPGIIAEEAFRQLTGRKVGGVVGWAWTLAWFTVWGNMIIDAFARGGVFGHLELVDRAVPGRAVIHGLVTNFDAWLRTM